jgi:aspartokinase/homoserine dehydrogenase 1
MSQARVVLLGVGAIGRELLRQLAANPRGASRPVQVCGLIDRSGFVFEPAGLSWQRAMEIRAHKVAGGAIAAVDGGRSASTAEAIANLSPRRGVRSILVDATADDTSSLLESAVSKGWDLVLANKVPLSGSQESADRLGALAAAKGRRVLCEATVGAGLPVIDTLRKLIDSGDRVSSVEGCPSGTLGFLFGELSRGRTFSVALRSASAAGYTEPDPRADLSGLDVARKALILGRLIGFRGELADIDVESLVPPALETVPAAAFIERAAELDEHWADRVRAARAQGAVLRYRARVSRQGIAVGLAPVSDADSLSRLTGTDNQFSFRTTRYRDQPLVISGPGAGPAVTAAGVYNDVLSIAGSRPLVREPGITASARRPRALRA